MIFAADPESILTAYIEHALERRGIGEGKAVPFHGLHCDLLEADALDLRVGSGKIFLHERRSEPNSVENLRAAIGLISRDAHLGHNFQNALINRLDVAGDGFLKCQLFIEFAEQLLESIECKIGIDGFGAIACKRTELMYLMSLACFDD